MTGKENYMRMIRGQMPAWVPMYSFGKAPGDEDVPAMGSLFPSPIGGEMRTQGPSKDIFGVTFVPAAEAGGAKIPEPNNFILDDITKWRDIVKVPDLSDVNWEMTAKKDLENSGIDRSQTAVILGLHFGYFQRLVAFMGFSEGLIAMFEEPEEVKALNSYLCDFYVDILEKSIDYYKPDILNICDDTAAWANPFISPEMHRELIKPFHARQCEVGTRRGIPIEMHNCGRCEDFIEDWRDFGVVAWNPAQISNDLLAIKKKYGRSLLIQGGWDIVGELSNPDVSEEVVKASVKESIDKYAPDGGYVFCGGFLGAIGDEKVPVKNRWLKEAVKEYGRHFYD